ncbi:hypothetical protein [Inquilinus sp.]|jgi:hypothetical protein|uniref:hypothetical protein n=1 Tax=Inquilinus sp. TaxID=1932117 RepID=UPI0037848CB5
MSVSETPPPETTRRGVLVAAAGSLAAAAVPAAAAAQATDPIRRAPTAVAAFRSGAVEAPRTAAGSVTAAATLRTEGFRATGDGGGALYREISPPRSPQAWQAQTPDGTWWELAETEVDVRQFGAAADGEADDVQAFRDALAYARAKGLRNIVARGRFAFGSTWDIDDISNQGIGIVIEELVALTNWPSPSAWRVAEPLIRLGKASKGSMINIGLHVGSIRGADRKADGVSIGDGGPGIGISQIWIGDAQDCNIAIKISGQTQPAASNRLTGNSLRNNNIGIYLDGRPRMCEGTRIQFNFIWSNAFGGLIAGQGSQYLDVHSQFDFNGGSLVELHVSEEIDQFSDHETVHVETGGDLEILARYRSEAGNCLLLLDGSRRRTGEDLFRPGTSLRTNRRDITPVSARFANQNGSRFYFDIILCATGQPFHRAIMNCPYLGGIVGQNLNTCSIFRGNSNDAGICWIAGHGFSASATQLLFYDGLRDGYTIGRQTPWLQVTADVLRPHRDVYIPDQRIFSSETRRSLRRGAWESVFSPSREAIPANGRRWLLSAQAIGTAACHAAGLLVQDVKGGLAATPLGAGAINFRVKGDALEISQNDDDEADVILSAVQIG